MNDKEFKNLCAKIVVTTARGEMRSGRVTNISKMGGYNREKFKVEAILKMSTGEFFRFAMNIEMEVPDSEFDRMWKELHDEIREAATHTLP